MSNNISKETIQEALRALLYFRANVDSSPKVSKAIKVFNTKLEEV